MLASMDMDNGRTKNWFLRIRIMGFDLFFKGFGQLVFRIKVWVFFGLGFRGYQGIWIFCFCGYKDAMRIAVNEMNSPLALFSSTNGRK